MNTKKFYDEIETLDKFFNTFCKEHHENQNNHHIKIEYKNSLKSKEIFLCDECYKLISYSIEKLKECPHEEKPRCRKCPNPCYEKQQWKALSKIMRYSGIKLEITTKLKKIFNP